MQSRTRILNKTKYRVLTLGTALLAFLPPAATLSHDDDKMKKDSVVVISESKEHDCAAAISCLKKVVEKVEDIN